MKVENNRLLQFSVIYFLAFFSFFQLGNAQTKSANDAVSILKTLQKKYDINSEYDLKMTYTMYRGLTGGTITEQYSGSLYKDKEVFMMKALDFELLQFKEGQIRIDHKSKKIQYSNELAPLENPTDLSKLLQIYKPVSLTEKNGIYKLDLELKSIQLSVPFRKITLLIDKQKNTLIKQILFLSNKLPFVTKEGKEEHDFARVEIDLSENKEKRNIARKKITDFIVKAGNQIKLSSKYKNYTLTNPSNL